MILMFSKTTHSIWSTTTPLPFPTTVTTENFHNNCKDARGSPLSPNMHITGKIFVKLLLMYGSCSLAATPLWWCNRRRKSMPHQEGGEYDVEKGPSRQEEKMESFPLPNPSAIRGGEIKCPWFHCPLWSGALGVGGINHRNIHTDRHREALELLVGFVIWCVFLGRAWEGCEATGRASP